MKKFVMLFMVSFIVGVSVVFRFAILSKKYFSEKCV